MMLPQVRSASVPAANDRSWKPQASIFALPLPAPTLTWTPLAGSDASLIATGSPARSVIVPDVPVPSSKTSDGVAGWGSAEVGMPSPFRAGWAGWDACDDVADCVLPPENL